MSISHQPPTENPVLVVDLGLIELLLAIVVLRHPDADILRDVVLHRGEISQPINPRRLQTIVVNILTIWMVHPAMEMLMVADRRNRVTCLMTVAHADVVVVVVEVRTMVRFEVTVQLETMGQFETKDHLVAKAS